MSRLLQLVASIRKTTGLLFLSKVEREYRRRCDSRPMLSDDEFVCYYYSASPISADIPLRVRRIFSEQMLCHKVIPTDTVWGMSDDFPFGELMREIAQEFNIGVSGTEIDGLDATFNSIVQLVARKRQSKQAD